MRWLWFVLHEHYSHQFFFNDTATPEIYTLSLHDALPIYSQRPQLIVTYDEGIVADTTPPETTITSGVAEGEPLTVDSRSEEHTSELQSRQYLVCRPLLEKKVHFIEHALSGAAGQEYASDA